MSAGDTPGPDAAGDPGRRDERPLPPRRPLPPDVPSSRGPWSPELRPPHPPRQPRPPRPARPWLRTLAIVVVTLLTVCGLMAIAFVVWLALALNSLSSNK